jgi:hypothetical protein
MGRKELRRGGVYGKLHKMMQLASWRGYRCVTLGPEALNPIKTYNLLHTNLVRSPYSGDFVLLVPAHKI